MVNREALRRREAALKTAVANYLRSRSPARGTRAEYHTTLKKWNQWGGGKPIEVLGRREIREFLDWVYERAVAQDGTNPGRTANKAREQLRAASAADWSDFLIELAQFERVVAEVFDGPGIEDQPGLDLNSLRSIASGDLSRLRLIGAPCLRLMQTQFAVNDWVGQSPDLALAYVLQRRDTCLVVTRNNYRVIWQEVECDEFQLLQRLIEGATLSDALISTAIDATADVGVLASRLQSMFCRWAALRLFVGVA